METGVCNGRLVVFLGTDNHPTHEHPCRFISSLYHEQLRGRLLESGRRLAVRLASHHSVSLHCLWNTQSSDFGNARTSIPFISVIFLVKILNGRKLSCGLEGGAARPYVVSAHLRKKRATFHESVILLLAVEWTTYFLVPTTNVVYSKSDLTNRI